MTVHVARLRAVRGRQIGPVGTAARLLGGGLAIALPIAFDGFSWFEAGVALLALPLIAAIAAPLITASYRRLYPGGGCEVLTPYNMISGRREQIGCLLYTPIDNVEATRLAGRRAPQPTGRRPER